MIGHCAQKCRTRPLTHVGGVDAQLLEPPDTVDFAGNGIADRRIAGIDSDMNGVRAQEFRELVDWRRFRADLGISVIGKQGRGADFDAMQGRQIIRAKRPDGEARRLSQAGQPSKPSTMIISPSAISFRIARAAV